MAPARRVFLGYTSELCHRRPDGRSFVDGAELAVNQTHDAPVHMRYFTADPRPPAAVCAEAVHGSDIFVIIVGFRWGSAVPDKPELSYTEFEYLEAEQAGVPRLVFLLDDALATDTDLADRDGTAQRQAAFRRRIQDAATETTTTVGTPEELTGKLLQALNQIDRDAPARAWNVPARNLGFTGREAALRELAKRLRTGPAAVPQAIDGMGGVGKTALVAEYAHRYREDYDIAWWVHAEDPLLAAGSLADLARQLGLAGAGDRAEQAIVALHSALRYRDRWLIVFDNATDPAVIAALIPPAPGHTVITSRGPHWDRVARRLPLDLPTADDASALLHRCAPHLSDDEARGLADHLDRLPLALSQAGAFLAGGQMTVAGYLELLRTRTREILRRDTPLDYPASFAASWEIAFERLGRENLAASQLMTICAYLSPEPIPCTLFLAHPNELPEPLAGSVRDPLAFADLTAHLRVQGLARVDVGSLQLHRLVQALLRDLDGGAGIGQAAARLLKAAVDDVPLDYPESWARWRPLLPHALASMDTIAPADVTADLAWVLGQAGMFVAESVHPGAAVVILERAAAEAHRAAGDDHPVTWEVTAGLAVARGYAGAPGAVLSSLEGAVAGLRRTKGPDDPVTLAAQGTLANLLGLVGRLDEALTLAVQTRDRLRTVTQPTPVAALHADTLVAMLLSEHGSLEDARSVAHHAYAAASRELGPGHPVTTMAASTLSLVLERSGAYADAVTLARHALDATRARLGDDHVLTLRAQAWLASALTSAADLESGRELGEQALGGLTRVVGPDHPDTLAAAVNLGTTLAEQGRVADATSLVEDTVARMRRTLGDDHPATLRAMSSVVLNLVRNGDYAQARAAAEELCDRYRLLLGDRHPDTIIATGNLAQVLLHTGDPDEALRLRRKVADDAADVLGTSHPVTLAAARSVAEWTGAITPER